MSVCTDCGKNIFVPEYHPTALSGVSSAPYPEDCRCYKDNPNERGTPHMRGGGYSGGIWALGLLPFLVMAIVLMIKMGAA